MKEDARNCDYKNSLHPALSKEEKQNGKDLSGEISDQIGPP